MTIQDFIDGLTPDDVGVEEIDGQIVYFEGFTDMCWEDAQEQGKTPMSLEQEILADWSERNGGLTLIEHGWTYDPVPFEDTIFFAIYQKTS
ncbi:MAG: hypothetical protein WCY71_12350 [Halothiobacillaceae bacterium]